MQSIKLRCYGGTLSETTQWSEGYTLKILYGVVGEGMGHAIRSSVILHKLVADGHDVHIVVSGRAHDFLKELFPKVSKIWGLTMVMEDNEVKNRLTAAENIKVHPSSARCLRCR